MTPTFLADLIATSIEGDVDAALDLAAGDGSLLAAIRRRSPKAALFGFELDPNIYRIARRNLPGASVTLKDGLRTMPRSFARVEGNLVIVSNPPFCEIEPDAQLSATLRATLPDTTTKHGLRRAELYFLARTLLLGKCLNARILIVLPISFAESSFWIQYRQALISSYNVARAVELPTGCFGATEARSVLLDIRMDLPSCNNPQTPAILRYEPATTELQYVSQCSLEGEVRLDARFYSRQSSLFDALPSLKECGVTITRGRISRKEAYTRRIKAIHTGDLRRHLKGQLRIALEQDMRVVESEEIYAMPGDILLPRTGSRTAWHPVVVTSGSAPITDHVFRVRSPQRLRSLIEKSFRHPYFQDWITSHIRGVCAAVLSKGDLMNMPVFSSSKHLAYDTGNSVIL